MAAVGNTLTREQNIANVFNQSGNTAVATPAMQKIIDTAKQQTAAASSPVAARLPGPSMPGATPPMASTPVASSGSNITPVPTGVKLAPGPYPQYDSTGKMTGATQGVPIGTPQTPQPMAATPPPQGAMPKTDYAAIAASRIAAQRAALAGSVTAYDASRKSAYDYMTKNTQDQRVLDAGIFNETNSPFSGKLAYDKTNILRNNGIQDTQNQTNYQNDISASDAKLAAFDAGSAGQQQDIMNQLQQQDFQNNIAQAPYTGQLNGNQTQQAQAQSFNQNIATNQDNRAAQGQTFNQNQTTQQFAYTQARDAIKDKQYQQQFDMDNQKYGLDYALKQATLNNQITNDQAQRAIGYMNANTSQQNANTSSANSSWAQDPNNPDNLYKQSEIAKNNAASSKTTIDPKTSVDNAQYYKSQIDASKGLTKDQMLSYAQNNATNMTDADYKALINYINNKY